LRIAAAEAHRVKATAQVPSSSRTRDGPCVVAAPVVGDGGQLRLAAQSAHVALVGHEPHALLLGGTCGTAVDPLWLVSTSAPWLISVSAASRSRGGSNQAFSHTTLTSAFGLAARMPRVKALMPCTTSGTGKPAT
jgi:hypothetical protein